MFLECLTLICIAVEVLVVGVPILVRDLRVDFTSGIYQRRKIFFHLCCDRCHLDHLLTPWGVDVASRVKRYATDGIVESHYLNVTGIKGVIFCWLCGNNFSTPKR